MSLHREALKTVGVFFAGCAAFGFAIGWLAVDAWHRWRSAQEGS